MAKIKPLYRLPWYRRAGKTWRFDDGGNFMILPFLWSWGTAFRFDGLHHSFGPFRLYRPHKKKV